MGVSQRNGIEKRDGRRSGLAGAMDCQRRQSIITGWNGARSDQSAQPPANWPPPYLVGIGGTAAATVARMLKTNLLTNPTRPLPSRLEELTDAEALDATGGDDFGYDFGFDFGFDTFGSSGGDDPFASFDLFGAGGDPSNLGGFDFGAAGTDYGAYVDGTGYGYPDGYQYVNPVDSFDTGGTVDTGSIGVGLSLDAGGNVVTFDPNVGDAWTLPTDDGASADAASSAEDAGAAGASSPTDAAGTSTETGAETNPASTVTVTRYDDGSTSSSDGSSTPSPIDTAVIEDPANEAIRAMVPENVYGGDQHGAPIDVDTTGVVTAQMSEDEAAAQDRDLRLNYRDSASPNEIYQGSGPTGGADTVSIGNCATVSVTNSILAQPGGADYIASLMTSNEDGSYTFRLVGADGQPQNVTVWAGHDSFAWSPNGPADPAVLFTTAIAYQQGQVPSIVESNPATVEEALAGRWPDAIMTAAGLVGVNRADGNAATGAVRVLDGAIPSAPTLGPHAYSALDPSSSPANAVNPWGYQHGLSDAPGGVRLSFGGELPAAPAPPPDAPTDPVVDPWSGLSGGGG